MNKMNIHKLLGNNKPLATSDLAYLACFMRLSSGCEQHHKAVKEEKKLPEPEQLIWIRFCSLELLTWNLQNSTPLH